jgi:outer membrane murein-binding lipoprotein Lpp
MSKKSKIVLGCAGIAVLLLGGFYYWNSMRSVAPENPEVSTLPTGENTSDDSLDTDLAAIDAQIQAVGSDTASANDSVNAAVSPQ